ncbi:DUF6221 family protein [Streptomyces sp. DR3-1]|uniref:DUF6221 family protein n=1 Tax=Streptomyces sp. DR3-1 TaxID=2951169 RepID=UPI0020447B21|nr:DUF6221 family protein [Streptomyces sp. DR3-1]MCM3822271.1 DUF6221 family protein [Streptomyces sp. DR3-1]
MTADLIAFLRARLDEDEARARALPPGPWTWRKGEAATTSPGDALVGADGQPVLSASDPDEYMAWIIRADGFDAYLQQVQPARVLAEVEAKRQIVGLHPVIGGWEDEDGHDRGLGCECCGHSEEYSDRGGWCETLRLLALSYADHPDYREEWRP